MQSSAGETPDSNRSGGLLGGIRVLEVAGPLGAYTGKLFADLGADVVLVEPPAGAAARRCPPFVEDVPGPERSLVFSYLNTSKRGVTLNIDTRDGRDLFRQMAAGADLVIESEPVGAMKSRGLDFDALAAARPSLVYTGITPFGRDGPYSRYVATDLVLLALGGFLCLGGYPETEPIRVGCNQAVLATDQFAAVGSLLALFDAEGSGRGRRVEVSAQECVVMALENAAHFYDAEGRVRRRTHWQRMAGQGVYPCQDGYVYLQARGAGTSKFWQPMVQWLLDEGSPEAEQLLEPKWRDLEYLEKESVKAHYQKIFCSLAMRRTKAELYHAALSRGIPLCPVNTPADLPESAQLKARDFFTTVRHGTLGIPMLMPGAPYRLSETPWRLTSPAPSLGQHNGDVYRRLGLDAGDLNHLAAEGVI